jgi:hypothetical protein
MGALILLRFVPVARVVEFFRRLRRTGPVLGRRDTDRLIEVADVAARVAQGSGRCLARSLLLFWLLGARGDRVSLVLGVARENSSIEGHAWLEFQDAVLADSRDVVGRYVVLARFA